jgi:DNA ligase-1
VKKDVEAEAEPEKEDTETKTEPESSPEDAKAEPKSSADVKEEINGDAMDVDSSSSETGRKRPVKEEEEDSEDAPPSKRQRRKPEKESEPANKPKAAPTKARKTSAKAKSVVEEDDDDEVAAPAKSKKAATKAKPVVREDDDDEVAAPAKAAKGKRKEAAKSQAPAVAVEEEGSSKEEEDILTSDEEPEEIKNKAREKVQTTLKSNTKDPYPDWKAGDPVPYAALCTTFSKIEMTTKRLEISAHCSLFLRQVLRLTPSDLLPTTLLMINKLAADYTGVELGIGESLIKKAISESTGRSLQHITSDHNEIGDLGLVAAKSRSKQPTMFKPKPLTVQGVHKGLLAIATIEGTGAQGRKVDGIKKLLSAADAENAGKQIDIEENKGGPSESKFIVRTLEGKLRLGLAERTVVVSLSQAMIFHEMSEKNTTPSTADLAKGESILKTVYRLVSPFRVCRAPLNRFVVNCRVMKSLSRQCSNTAS